ncbi:hypothetical protein [Thalassotalea maritima]|uniref:hypothetical protein n=1 Tax=Thalassotalea maritima TaxID=3242416 RepID=UPI0035278E36
MSSLSRHIACRSVQTLLVSGALLSSFTLTAKAVEDELIVADIVEGKVTNVRNITNRVGYDNQPHFSKVDKALLYTSMFTIGSIDNGEQQQVQTDSMRFDLTTQQTINLTNTLASEYSPTITPDGEHFSVIRVGRSGKQLLHRYPYNSGDPQGKTLMGEVLLPEVYDVGYHVWLNADELLLFVLGEPMRLERADVRTGKSTLVDTNIGRTLRSVPNQEGFSYTKEKQGRWQLKVYNADTNSVSEHTTLPDDNMYYAWHPDGRLLSAHGNVIMQNNDWKSPITPQDMSENWQPFADMSASCRGKVTRLAVNEQGDKLAFVCSVED